MSLFHSPKDSLKIATFDSGIGGFHITEKLLALKEKFPHSNHEIIHIADIKNLPYGSKSRQDIISYVSDIAHKTLESGCDYFIICCNTASVHIDGVIDNLKPLFPNVEEKIISLKSFTYDLLKDYTNRLLKEQTIIRFLFLATPATILSRNYVNYMMEEYNLLPFHAINAQTTEDYLFETLEFNTADYSTIHITALAPIHWVKLMENEADFDLSRQIEQDFAALKEFDGRSFDGVGLFCTHYPIIQPEISKYLKKYQLQRLSTSFLSQTTAVTNYISSLLEQNKSQSDDVYAPRIYLTTEESYHFESLFQKLFPHYFEKVTFENFW